MEKKGGRTGKGGGVEAGFVFNSMGNQIPKSDYSEVGCQYTYLFFGYNLNSSLLPQNTLHSFSFVVKQNIHSNCLNQTTTMSSSQK